MSKATPGPWRVVSWLDQRSAPKIHIEAGDRTTRPTDWHRVCSLLPSHNGDRIEANADLIAAAPELRDALRDLLIVLEHGECEVAHPDEVENRARALLERLS